MLFYAKQFVKNSESQFFTFKQESLLISHQRQAIYIKIKEICKKIKFLF
jgi:hypothetical protein